MYTLVKLYSEEALQEILVLFFRGFIA